MAKITWLGTGDKDDPATNYWNNIAFPINQPVEISDPQMIEVASWHHHYRLEEAKHVEEKVEEEKPQSAIAQAEENSAGKKPVKKASKSKAKKPDSADADPAGGGLHGPRATDT
jgi:hypothetical protein